MSYIDEDDAADVLWVGATSGGGGCFVVCLVLALILLAIASANSKECSEKKCDHGVPKLLDHECLCIEPTKP